MNRSCHQLSLYNFTGFVPFYQRYYFHCSSKISSIDPLCFKSTIVHSSLPYISLPLNLPSVYHLPSYSKSFVPEASILLGAPYQINMGTQTCSQIWAIIFAIHLSISPKLGTTFILTAVLLNSN